MAVTPAELLQFAQSFVGDTDEVSLRAAASRAYYCGYHSTQSLGTLLPEPPYVSEVKGSHDRHIKKFADFERGGTLENYYSQIRGMGFILQQMRSLRTRADYKIDEEFLASQAEETVHFAQKLLDKLGEVPLP